MDYETYGKERNDGRPSTSSLPSIPTVDPVPPDFPDGYPEGGAVSEPRVVSDPWSEPAARRALAFTAVRKFGPAVLDRRVDPFPMDGTGHDLRWLCSASQDDVDEWRTSDDDALATTEAVTSWLAGTYMTFGGALAASFPLSRVWDAALDCLRERASDVLGDRTVDVLRRRVRGDTLESIAVDCDLTRERIRQIERAAVERLTERLAALRGARHPISLACSAHANRLAGKVLVIASRDEVALLNDARRRWVRHALAVNEADFLETLLLLAEDAEPELHAVLDPFERLGWPFQGGLTVSQWRDRDVTAVTNSFARIGGGGERRRARVADVSASAELPDDAVRMLAPFASLTVQGDWLFEGRVKAAELRRAMLTDVMAGANRPMHEAELLQALLSAGFARDTSLRDIHNAMADNEGTFASDGQALWQLRACLGHEVKDRRPEHPELPPPMQPSELAQALATMSACGPVPDTGVLDNLAPETSEFAPQAGRRLADALARIPAAERVSLAQVLRPADETKLLIWLRQVSSLVGNDGAAGELSPRILESLTLLAAFVSVVRASKGSDASHWAGISVACGQGLRQWVFNLQGAPRQRVLSRFVETVTTLRLRHAFSCQSDPWKTLLTIQAGMLPGDARSLQNWLASGQPPSAIRQLVASGDNHSASMACTWNTLLAYRRGQVGRDAVEELARSSEWWPGWTVDEACSVRPERRLAERPRVMPAGQASAGGLLDTDGQRETGQEPDAFVVALASDGSAFRVVLPSRLPVSPGSVAAVGEDFRVGGDVGPDGSVTWHARVDAVPVRLRGRSERVVRVERGSDVLATYPVRFWAANDHLVAFRLGEHGGGAFDPFANPLPRTGGVALLISRFLQVSAQADGEHALDGDHVLLIFRSGIPAGTTVSCDGEVFWTAEAPTEIRRVVPDLAVYLRVAGDVRWGELADLVVDGAPAGFVPQRAWVGSQSLAARPDGDRWLFPDFAVLPGMDSLRRRGRVNGLLAGERVTVPATVSLGHVPVGAALRDGDRWRALDPSARFETGRDGTARLWACLPGSDEACEWTVFEGPRVALPYRRQGITLGKQLQGLGEPLKLARGHFNLDGPRLPLADSVLDTGIVVACERDGTSPRLRLSTPLAWTGRHRAVGWSPEGIVELQPVPTVTPSRLLDFEPADGRVDGVCLFHDSAWLGSGFLAEDASAATAAFVARAPDWPNTLSFALMGRLPVLAHDAMLAVAKRLRTDGARGLVALLSAAVDGVTEHACGRLLETWEAEPEVAGSLVEGFRKALATGANGSVLEKLVACAPCSTVRVLAHGSKELPGHERTRVFETLVRRLLPSDLSAPVGMTAVEGALLDRALGATRLDRNFLAARGEGSIASLAWATASLPTPCRLDGNLATALATAPVRRWLSVHLIIRLNALYS